MTQLVPDVEAFPGHIACDGATKSEIVVPVFDDTGRKVGVLDVDCETASGFDETDRVALERLASMVGKACAW